MIFEIGCGILVALVKKAAYGMPTPSSEASEDMASSTIDVLNFGVRIVESVYWRILFLLEPR